MKITTLAERIKTRREELGLQPVDLAYAAGVTVAAVMQWESGLIKSLKSRTLFAVAAALNVTPQWLESGEGEKDATSARKAYRAALERRDREGDDRVRLAWDRIAACFARAALASVLLLLLPFIAAPPTEARCCNAAESLHIMSKVRRLARRIAQALSRRLYTTVTAANASLGLEPR